MCGFVSLHPERLLRHTQLLEVVLLCTRTLDAADPQMTSNVVFF